MPRPVMPAAALIAATLVLVPLPYHWRVRNYGIISIIAWMSTVNLIYAVDTIIWADSVDVVAEVWCEITTRIIVGASVAVPACCLSIAIRMDQLASCREATAKRLKRQKLVDIFLCWVCPVIVMALYYTVQDRRFIIFQIIGCRPMPASHAPALVLLYVTPLILSLLTFFYASSTLLKLLHRRSMFARYLAEVTPAMSYNTFLRLKIMVIIQLTGSMLFNSLVLWFASKNGIPPYPGWAAAHKDFWQIPLIPTIFWGDNYIWILLMWWAAPASAFTFCALFSFTSDVRKEYRAGFAWFLGVVLKRHVDEERKKSIPKMTQKRREGALLSVSSIQGIRKASHHSYSFVISHRDDFGAHAEYDLEGHLLTPSPAVLRNSRNGLPDYYFESQYLPNRDKSR